MVDLFWVGGAGGGVYSNGALWSLASGGGGGAGPPGAADNVTFDALSGAGTCTIDGLSLANNVVVSGFPGSIAGSTNTWRVSGDITGLAGKFTPSTGTLELDGGSQTVGPSGASNLNINLLLLSGAGEKAFNVRLVATTTAGIRATADVQMTIGTGTNDRVFGASYTWFRADSGFTLTWRSANPGTRWKFNSQGGRTTFTRCDIRDCDGLDGATQTVGPYATDYTNTDSGNNTGVNFTPVSSAIEEDTSFFTGASLDYGPQAVTNSSGDIVMLYADGTSVNNSRVLVRYSQDGGRTWSARTVLHSSAAQGDGIVDNAVGAGWELWVVIDPQDVLYVVGHKLLGGNTRVWFSKCDVTDVTAVDTFSNWLSADGTPPSASGAAVDGQGYDDVRGGFASDPSVAVNSKGEVIVGYNPTAVASGPAAVRVFRGGSWSSAATLNFDGSNNPEVVDVVCDRDDNLHMLTNNTEGGFRKVVYKTCPVSKDPSVAENWVRADGTAGYDVVIDNGANNFFFPHPRVDADGNLHVIAETNGLVDGFARVFHNVRLRGSPDWENGSGTEINGTAAFPSRTRCFSNARIGLTPDRGGNMFLFYIDQQTRFLTYHRFDGSARTWGAQTVLRVSNNGNTVSDLRPMLAGVPVQESGNVTGRHPGLHWQAVTGATRDFAWWDYRQSGRFTTVLGTEVKSRRSRPEAVRHRLGVTTVTYDGR